MVASQPSTPAMVGSPRRRSGSGVRGSLLTLPTVVPLLLWSVLPLIVTLWFSFRRYNLMNPARNGFDGFGNYRYLLSDPGLGLAVWNTVLLLGSVLVITIGLGTLLAILLDQEFFGRGIVRVLMLAPFFIMPTVSALLWKNMMMHPDNGFLAFLMRSVGLKPIDWFAVAPLTSIIIIVSWEWLPFCRADPVDRGTIIGLGAQGGGQDGWCPRPIAMFRYIIWPHLGRAIAATTMIETIFILGIFAEIYVTSAGGPGFASTNLSFLIYRYVLMEYDIGGAAVAGLLAIVLANILAAFLLRSFARNLDT